MVHARAVATGHRGVVDRVLACHPGGVNDAVVALDRFGGLETEVVEVCGAFDDVGVDLIEVVKADKRACALELVVPGEPLDVLDLVEKLVGEAKRVDDPQGVGDTLGELAAAGFATELLVVGLGLVDLLLGANAEGEGGDTCDRALAQNEVVVDELLEGAQVDRVVVLFGDDEAEDVDVELAGGREVGDDEVHVGAAQDVRRGDGGGWDEI